MLQRVQDRGLDTHAVVDLGIAPVLTDLGNDTHVAIDRYNGCLCQSSRTP